MKKSLIRVILPIVALCFVGILVILERMGITYNSSLTLNNESALSFTSEVTDEAECLILTDNDDEISIEFKELMEVVLDGMKINYDVADPKDSDFGTKLKNYKTVVITFEDFGLLGDNLEVLFDWIEEGGSLMNTQTPSPNDSFFSVAERLGITNNPEKYVGIKGFMMLNDSMIGAEAGEVFTFDIESGEEFEISLAVKLSEDCTVYMASQDGNVPLLWERDYGEGKVVVMNETLTEKYQRGFLCLAYTLLDDVSIYPVINASAYYLDDFPAPVPSGNGEYIKRDYGISISTFYATVWWPKIIEWEKKYGIKHTGVIIEQYSDVTEGTFDTNTSISQFTSYGNLLLINGGELGLHGYNHMPLCLEGVDDDRQYGEYKLWKTKEDMVAAVTELYNFSKELFPSSDFSVYVPPSNIISETGIEALIEACPQIKVLASTFMKDADGIVYEQDYGVDENGLIHAPRITSGCDIDEYQTITALSELNFQFVQSHFTHPDDILDEDRGASLGWEALSESFESYLDWISTSATDIRNMTGSEMGTAVLQYDSLSLIRELTDHELRVNIGGFSGEAYFMMRVNEGVPEDTEGCTITKMTGNLYLVHATNEEIKITLGE